VGVKRSGRKADHSPPSSTEVKNPRNYTPSGPCVFMTCCLVEQRIPLHGMALSQAQGIYLTFEGKEKLFLTKRHAMKTCGRVEV
jgi:hypothetical protein